jgi:hypothetical protein
MWSNADRLSQLESALERTNTILEQHLARRGASAARRFPFEISVLSGVGASGDSRMRRAILKFQSGLSVLV